MPDHRFFFEPMGISCVAGEGPTLLEVAQEHGIALRSECGGKGRCGKCRILAHPPGCLTPLSPEEHQRLTKEEIEEGQRMACQARPVEDGTILLPPDMLEGSMVIGKTGIHGTYPVNPMVERIVLPPDSSMAGHKQGIRDLVGKTVLRAEGATGRKVTFQEMEAVRQLSQPSMFQGAVTLVSHEGRGITAVLQGERTRSLGFALDIGTSTLAVYLCDLKSGEVLASATSTNPQRRFGEDVISRIAFANEHPGGKDTLHKLVIEEINALGRRCLEAEGAERQDVDEVSVVGNPTMEHLFAGIHPHSLGLTPYLPVRLFTGDMRAGDLCLDFNPGTNVHLFPVISGFVGGDTMGVILAETPHERDEVSLIVDIGTNGEVILGNREGLWVTSCATGPAFEGAQIACGMRATSGAIHQVDIEPSGYKVSYRVVGEQERERPRGICGSGIIDAVAAMGRAGLLLSSGRIKEGLPGVLCDDRGIGRRFILVPLEDSGTGREIAVTLSDIRQIQLAKAALYAGIKLLMRRAGITHIDRMVLTGAFGARFNWQNAVSIGMLPRPSEDTSVEAVENAAGVGAIMALLDRTRREEARNLVEKIRFLELAEDSDFLTEFPMAMNFPF